MKKMYILALISALICGFLLYSFLGSVQAQGSGETIERREVLVAAMDIPPYTDLTESMFVVKALPVEGLHSSAATSFSQLQGKKSESSFLKGEVIIASKFGEDVEKLASYKIPEGMRVMTLSVGSASGLDQNISKGDFVDVLFTAFDQEKDKDSATQNASTDPYGGYTAREQYPQSDEEKEIKYLAEGVSVKESVTSLLLENVEVFSTGSALDAEGTAYSTVSLLLTPQDCLRMYASENYGGFSFVLRGHDDASASETTPIFAADILPKAETAE